jgi:DNA-binding NarL/FixJ family response regulator
MVLKTGNADTFVSAYRASPELLKPIAARDEWRGGLAKLLLDARDRTLGAKIGLTPEFKRVREFGGLSPRELEVLDLISQGLSNREIAKALFVSETTIKVHVRHILEKLHVRTRTEAAVRANHRRPD